MELYFLGTTAGTPNRYRNVTSLALTLYEERGSFWMFDCGEGTQHQILKSPLKLGKLEKLFITHLHGDHVFGIPGLLSSRAHQGGSSPLTVFGPKGIRELIDTSLSISQSRLEYSLEVIELEEEGVIFEDSQFIVEFDRVDHRIECFGYRVVEKDRPGSLNIEALTARGIQPGPIYRQLKQGVDVELPDGSMLRSAEFIGKSVPGRVIAVIGDTRSCERTLAIAHHADVMVHEATYGHALTHLAVDYGHSTAVQAARLAERAHVKALILTHFSSRYQGDKVKALLDEAKEIFPETHLAEDFWSFPIPRKKL